MVSEAEGFKQILHYKGKGLFTYYVRDNRAIFYPPPLVLLLGELNELDPTIPP